MADPRWPPFGNHDLLRRDMTSLRSVTDLKGDIVGRNIYRQSLTVISFILPKL